MLETYTLPYQSPPLAHTRYAPDQIMDSSDTPVSLPIVVTPQGIGIWNHNLRATWLEPVDLSPIPPHTLFTVFPSSPGYYQEFWLENIVLEGPFATAKIATGYQAVWATVEGIWGLEVPGCHWISHSRFSLAFTTFEDKKIWDREVWALEQEHQANTLK